MNPLSKPLNVIIFIGVIVLITAGIIVSIQTSKRSVAFNLKGNDYSVAVYEGKKELGKNITSLNTSTAITLYDGYYCYVITGNSYSDTEECFTVFKKDKDIEVTPKLSDDTLAKLLSREQPVINAAVEEVYGSMLATYESIPGKLLVDDTWYVGILKERTVNPEEIFDTYVYILKKTNNTWQVAVSPRFVVSAVEFNTLPKEVIDNTNAYLDSYTRNLDY